MTVDYEPWETCWIKAQSYTTTRNLILGGSAGKLRERGTTVAWEPRREVDTTQGVTWDLPSEVDTRGGPLHGVGLEHCQWRRVSLTVAWDPWQDQDALLLGLEELTLSVERSLTDSSLEHTKEGRGRTPRSRSSWGLVTKCGHYSRNSQDLWDGKDILLCLCVD